MVRILDVGRNVKGEGVFGGREGGGGSRCTTSGYAVIRRPWIRSFTNDPRTSRPMMMMLYAGQTMDRIPTLMKTSI